MRGEENERKKPEAYPLRYTEDFSRSLTKSQRAYRQPQQKILLRPVLASFCPPGQKPKTTLTFSHGNDVESSSAE